MERFGEMSQDKQRMVMMGTAALIGATTALYGLKKVFSTPEPLSPFYDY